VTSEPRLDSPVWFEIDRAGAHSEVLWKTGVSGFGRFDLQRRRAGDEDRANVHISDVWEREGKDRG
jgi:hypothetical protein